MIQSYFPVVRGRIHGALAPRHDIAPSPFFKQKTAYE
eukprot:COSAG06_NODE_12674_length_1344_cov_0.963052_2_plen_36_part_01